MGTLNDIVTFNMLKPLKRVDDTYPSNNKAVGVPNVTPIDPSLASNTVAVSDATAKTNIKPGDAKIDELLSHAGAHQYEYKDKADGDKTYVSPMAQELQQTEIGKSAVINTPDGLKVDYSRLMGASMSALALHHEDIKRIDKTLDYLAQAVAKKKKK